MDHRRARSIDTVVVGAGQAGLVMSSLLRLGSANLVGLERDAAALAARI